jgi:hypothetical protein
LDRSRSRKWWSCGVHNANVRPTVRSGSGEVRVERSAALGVKLTLRHFVELIDRYIESKLTTREQREGQIIQRLLDALVDWDSEASRANWRTLQKMSLAPCSLDGDDLEFLLPLQWNERHAYGLVDQAKHGDPDAHRVLCEAVIELNRRQVPLPPELCNYADDVMLGRAPKLNHPGHGNEVRNVKIVSAAKRLCRLGYKLTRRDKSGPECASSIIARWTVLSEAAVAKILQQRQGRAKRRRTR